MVDKVDKIWLDGELVDWDAADVHVLTHSLHYGLGAFEGIRCYSQEGGGGAVFRLREHIDRLRARGTIAHCLSLECRRGLQSVYRYHPVNKLDECYIRPLVFVGDGSMGLAAMDNKSRLAL